jgi:hypothetical protein
MPQGDEHIEQIRTALWSQSKQPGASVMIGAGFSRNAVKLRPDAPPFLTWPQLATRFEQKLEYPSTSGRGTSDALRLASEFECAFGSNELEKLLREAAPDDLYKPGPLHSLLVSLPWVDIFTTNYDQLLERASRETPERRYSAIRTIHDIPLSARPRIVKLHGSFPSHRPFIITEEHYRAYPQEFAPFANLVRQAVMETVFCLLGFSGDDPNFLQWAGWVRDSLGAAAPAIYLCGVLDLTLPKQHLLRSRHVIPIDLASRFPRHEYPDPDTRHSLALEWFLLSLLAGQPIDDSNWPTPPPSLAHDDNVRLPPILAARNRLAIPAQNSSADTLASEAALDVPTLLAQISKWHTERNWYPGWICLPERNRMEMWLEMRRWMSDPHRESWIRATQSLPPAEALLAWHEIAWRIERTLCPLVDAQISAIEQVLEQINPFPKQVTDLQATFTPETDIFPSAQWPRSGTPALDWANVARCWVELAFAIVRCAREDFNVALHTRWMHRLALVTHLGYEYQDRYLYERAALHLFRLEQQKLSETLSTWQPEPTQPYWQAKHAALLAESGDLEGAKAELRTALTAQQMASQDQSSRQALSEEGWILWLLDSLDNDFGPGPHVRRSYDRNRRLNNLSQYGCDPDDVFRALSRRLREAKLRRVDSFRGDDPFDPGYRKRPPVRIYQNDPEAWFFVRALEIGATFVRAPGHSMHKEAVVESALGLFFDVEGQRKFALSLLLRCGANDPIAGLLDRATIASLEPDFVTEIYQWLARALREAIKHTSRIRLRDNNFSARLIAPLMQTISYLLFRLSSPYVADARSLLVELYRAEILHSDRESIRILRLLFRRAFYCMSPEQVRDWLPDLLTLPMSESRDSLGIDSLPEVLEEWRHPDGVRIQRDGDSGQWADIVATLLATIGLTGEKRSRAATRLFILYLVGGLTHSEELALAESLWRQRDQRMLPKETNLREAMWLRLPAPSGVNPSELLRQMFLSEEYPRILRDHGEKQGISSGGVSEFVDHVSSIEECSQMTFRHLDRRQGISWTHQEANVLLEKLEGWTTANVSARHRDSEMFDDARAAAISLLMHVLIPIFSSDIPTMRRMITIANMLWCADRRMTVVNLLQRLAGDISAESLGEALVDAFYDLTPSGKDRVEEAGDVLLLWLSCADGVLTDAPSRLVMGRIVESLVSIRHTELVSRLVVVSKLLQWFPAQIDDYNVQALERMLEYLADATALPIKIPSDPAARSDARAKPLLRAISAYIAFRLFQLYSARSRPVSSIVERWRNLVEQDPLPEVRLAWSDSFHIP